MTMRLARLSKDPALMRRAIDMHMAVRRAEKTIRFVLIAFSIHLVISLVMAIVAFTMKISGGTSSLGVAAACVLAITLAMMHRAPVAEEREALDRCCRDHHEACGFGDAATMMAALDENLADNIRESKLVHEISKVSGVPEHLLTCPPFEFDDIADVRERSRGAGGAV